ncbi:Potassium-transporting ATPase KdpC subunit [Emticicia aquatica]|jgi:K+-transporting ATPase ATPase C chain|uniref:Potassium-transporting ATPase KdpC subunit n=1 Tax=Emticicia aquatica TaxID=1681835 RepID=A0ABN8EWD0_9BACT|nr:K(+)-transporting ATPase subunit C [Emticicia aquatica]CAH0995929.1 Potassium-transporting ATPase KdpC subunit [Emticicia aquatica]
MKSQILPAIKLTFLSLVLLAIVYPLIILGIAQFAPNSGKVQFIERNNKIIGAENVGQKFDQDRYFYSRPSVVNYNAASSGGSNKGPSNPDYLATVQARIDTFLVHNPTVAKADIPSELVTASGSGLDPHISPKGALVQVDRIAKKRNISNEKLINLIKINTEKPFLGLFGTEKINVLKLNLALDNLK